MTRQVHPARRAGQGTGLPEDLQQAAASLDWNDREAVMVWLDRLRVALEDADDMVQDMLLPPRKRDFGPALHAEKYREAWAQVLQVLAYATPPGSKAVKRQ